MAEYEPSTVVAEAQKLVDVYPDDLEAVFIEECLHFRAHLISVDTQEQHALDIYMNSVLKIPRVFTPI